MTEGLEFLLVFETTPKFAQKMIEFTRKINAQQNTEIAASFVKAAESLMRTKEGKEIDNMYKRFINLLRENYPNSLRINSKGSAKEIAVTFEPSAMADQKNYHVLNLGSEFLRNKGHYYHVLTFSGDTLTSNQKAHADFFIDVFLKGCIYFKPIFGTAVETGLKPEERPCFDQAEYYKNPYFFCVEPSFGKLFGVENFDFSFLTDVNLLAKIAELEKVINVSELVDIIKNYSEKVIISDDGGIGVFKGYWQTVYPRYFVRQELRRRGIQIEEGLAEEYAKESGVN